MIIKEYNLNLIILNKLIENTVILEISNFLYNNNLSLTEKSRDLKVIIEHFLITGILQNIDINYKNIIIYSNTVKLDNLDFLDKELFVSILLKTFIKSSKKFKFCIFETDIIDLLDDKNLLNKVKHFTNCRKKIDYTKLSEYCANSKLKEIKDKLLDNKIKLKLNK